jgi:allantoate deiminase
MPITGTRLNDRIARLAEFGQTPDGGVTRPTFAPAYLQAAEAVADWMSEAGLAVRRDAVGNLIGRREGDPAGLPAVALGSHIDTVLGGGRYDGALGVLSALEVAQALHEDGVSLRHPLEVISFMEEEGTRWATGMLGSRFMVGHISEEFVRERADRQGVTIREALAGAGLDPSLFHHAARTPDEFHAYVELHIEQSTVLESLGLPVGAVTGIAGPLFLALRLHGRADHAGATPMHLRRDALIAASQIVLAAQEAPASVSSTAVATVGRLEIRPGAINVIPGEVFMTFDLRDIVEAQRDNLEHSVRAAIERIATAAGLRYELEELTRHVPVPLPEHMVNTVCRAIEAAGLPVHRLPSGAGHDAQIMAEVTDTAMIFVRSREGISHNPREYSSPEDIVAGAEVLYHTVVALDR